ncbi:hypothetical protein ACFXOD_29705 [Streptomyces sp. NPDC059161]|uniref:hypothetical protein n=1 Tax=Streptomyces sp. NPDC059161 TaxID=3346749 RepID=UPI003686ADCF
MIFSDPRALAVASGHPLAQRASVDAPPIESGLFWAATGNTTKVRSFVRDLGTAAL